MFKIRAWVSAVLAAALVVLGGIVAVSASAHTPSVVADCDQLAVTLTSYNGSGTNTVKVTIGGDVVEDATFGASFQETYDAPDKYKDYAYEVAVTAHDDPTGSKGWTKTFTGTSKACKEPGNGHTPVNVCHATNSDSNPYVFITVDDDSVKLQGHLMHRQTPNKTWKSDGVWRGTVVHAGDAKPDLIGDYTDKQGVKHTYDGVITSKSDCGKLSPPEVTKPTGSYDQECVYGGVQVTIGQLDDGTYSDVTWTFTHGNVSSQVSSGDQVLVQSGEQLSLSWASGESTGTAKSGVAKDCPPPVVTEPSGSFEQECVEGGVRVTITGLDAGTSDSVTWSFTHGGTTVSNVTEGQQILVQSGEQLVLAWNSSDGNGTAKSGTAKECPPPVQDEFGKIKIKKDMEGPVAGASTTFTVRVDCPGTAYDQDVVLSSANSWVATTGNIPTGTVCTLTEVKVPNGWNPEGITPDTVTVGSGTPSQVSAVALNKRRTGRVHIHKTIVGDPAGASTTFTVHLDCDGTAYDQDVVLNQANQWTFDKGGFPSGIDCRVTEPNVPAGWTLTSVTPSGAFTIDSYDTITVEVVNTRTVTPPPTTPTTGVITVTKVLEGAVNGAETSFVFDVDCPGTAYDQKVTVAVTNGTSASGTTGQIPTGSTCTVTERSTSGWQQKSVVPANGTVAVGSTVTFTNSRRTGALAISKAVTPVAGNGVVVGFGDTLTYTMTVSATGSLTQSGVVVTDYVPGSDPARPGSAATTYKAGSAACIGAGTCTVTGPDAHGLITWQLGDMAAGSSRQVTFQVTVDEVTGDPGETVAVDVLNAAAVRSATVTTTPSNEVSTPVTEVLPVKQGHKPPSVGGTHLPHTGAGLPVGAAAGMGGLLVLMGLGLVLVARPRNAGMRRA